MISIFIIALWFLCASSPSFWRYWKLFVLSMLIVMAKFLCGICCFVLFLLFFLSLNGPIHKIFMRCLCTPASFITERSFRGLNWWFGLFPSRWWSLAGDPDRFPLDDEAYPLSSHWLTLTHVILRSYLVFRVCLDLIPLLRPAPKQCFPYVRQ